MRTTRSIPAAMTAVAIALALTAAIAGAPLARGAAPPDAASSAGSLDSQVDASGPPQLVRTTADTILKELDAHRADYRKDPAKVHALVDRVLLPHFDTEYSARLVLGRHWAEATPEQRTRFIAAFYKSLLDNYGDALVDFTGDRLKVLPYTGDPAAQNAIVRTQIRKEDGSLIAVNYTLRHTDAGWKAWDLTIEGISYVKSFREDFDAEIDQQGLDAVIAKLESGVKPSGVKSGKG